jgi:hypothetical protein
MNFRRFVPVLFLLPSGAIADHGASDPARQDYDEALRLLKAGDRAAAITHLNAAVLAQPQFAEAYAARGAAQLEQGRPAGAAADYAYVLRLNPSVAAPLYGLGLAHRAMKHDWIAAQYFQLYVESHASDVQSNYRDHAADLAQELHPAPGLFDRMRPRAAECQMGASGEQVCGYNCRLGADGIVGCANTADGVCAVGANGHVACSQLAVPPPTAAPIALAPGGAPARAPAAAPPSGAFCHGSLDCGSGEFCKDRGDHVNVCMGNGSRGESCASSIDCGSSMFCKDRGDGFKVCM